MKIRRHLRFLRRSLHSHAAAFEQQHALVKLGMVAIIAVALITHNAHRRYVADSGCSSGLCTKSFIESLFRAF
ncbi:MAG: hypothetical protein ACK45R_02770 [Candidatus Kapaibacterium sp.]|jgi:hypothetical protein